MKAIGRAAIWFILSIWIIMAAGCAGSDTAQREEGPVCWASAQLQGGSGKAFVETPCPVYEKEGTLCALITWSSKSFCRSTRKAMRSLWSLWAVLRRSPVKRRVRSPAVLKCCRML